MGGPCSAYWGEERLVQGFGWETLVKETTWKIHALDVRIILRWIFRKRDGGGVMDWIELAQDRNRWRALANEVMKVWVT